MKNKSLNFLKNPVLLVLLFMLLFIVACQNKQPIEAQFYAVSTVKNSSELAHYQADKKMMEIKKYLEINPSKSSIYELLVNFDQKLEKLTNKLTEARLKFSTDKWGEQVMSIYQHFAQFLDKDSLLTVVNFPDTFRQKIADFPRAFSQIREKIAKNSQAKEYWQRYMELIFNLLEVELYQNVLNAILPQPCPDADYQLIAYADYTQLPQVGKPQKIKILIAPYCQNLLLKSKTTVSLYGENFQIKDQPIDSPHQFLTTIRPTKAGKTKITLSISAINPLTGETYKFSRDNYFFVHK